MVNLTLKDNNNINASGMANSMEDTESPRKTL